MHEQYFQMKHVWYLQDHKIHRSHMIRYMRTTIAKSRRFCNQPSVGFRTPEVYTQKKNRSTSDFLLLEGCWRGVTKYNDLLVGAFCVPCSYVSGQCRPARHKVVQTEEIQRYINSGFAFTPSSLNRNPKYLFPGPSATLSSAGTPTLGR